ncbi:hypothetical protein CH255_19795 [Rhodococcus sp. 05-2255-2A2]|uniref:hypothetical protein n=1 Tax=unclassified Rhodococcus (in: high G+C Gram-positive bacteria) TaxID=192944 RepID=UPI000B9BC2F5|nr:MULTISPECIES: hypothetical protein [unclassified Rhodococcus (in: high G+C Gram-positive bacteria)]OZE03893.1 hypothetical protein CH250_22645 [Rhodococcus sp. 05-2255-3C]OZE17046.1 hypothetical protein CH255_19795 [Rhodococcus sp. 05-2255-2A2]
MADTENTTEPSAQPIIEWTDDEGRKHHAAEGTFAHKAHLAEEELKESKAAAAAAAPATDADQGGDADVAKTDAPVPATPAELTSTPGGRPAGPPKASAPKSS